MRFELTDETLQQLVEEVVYRVRAELEPSEQRQEWLSVDTAARYLDVSAERIRKLTAGRDLPHYQEGPGCRIFFRRSELDAWMIRTRIAPRREPEGA